METSKEKKPFPDISPGFYTFCLWLIFFIFPGLSSVIVANMPTWSSIWINFLIIFGILCLVWNVASILFRWYDTPGGRRIPPAVMGNVTGFLYLVPLWRFAGEPLWLGILLVFHYFFCTWVSIRFGKEIYQKGSFRKNCVGNMLLKIGLLGPFAGGLIALILTRNLVGIFIGMVLAACGTVIILYFTVWIRLNNTKAKKA